MIIKIAELSQTFVILVTWCSIRHVQLYNLFSLNFIEKISYSQLKFDLLFKPCLKKFSSTAKNCWNGSWSSETTSPSSREVSIRFLIQRFRIFRRLVRSVFHSCFLLLSVADKLLWGLVKVLDQPRSWSSSSPDTVAILFSFNTMPRETLNVCCYQVANC